MTKGWVAIAGIGLSLSALGLGGCATVASVFDTRAPDPAGHNGYMAAAAASDLFEIESAQAALARAQRPDVRAYAEMLLRDHTRSSVALAEAARRGGFVPAAGILDSSQQVMLNQLQNSGTGTADALYVSQKIDAHARAYALHRNYGLSGDSVELREHATMIAPIVREHQAAAERLRG